MPTYVYRREDGTTFEIEQRITEPALEQCPETGQPVKRVISGSAGLIFKGEGFYLTDYARKGKGNGSSNKEETSAKEGEASKSSETSTKSETSKTTETETGTKKD